MADDDNDVFIQNLNVLPSGFNFDALASEVRESDIPWARHYHNYQSGGWWTCSLLGRSKSALDGEVTDNVEPFVTDVLDKLPITRELLQEMRLQYMLVRLARLDPNGFLWEHRDYQDLRRVPRQRIHLPVDTNPEAFLVSAGCRFHMGPAALWSFRPTAAHGACNMGGQPRVHLILDVYEDECLRTMMAEATALPFTPMPDLAAHDLAEKVRHSHMSERENGSVSEDTGSDRLMKWEQSILKLYFKFAVQEGELYNALEHECGENGDIERAGFWKGRHQLMLGEGLHDG
jgi:Aspartyl/Asparaginyl beta-hydroxylase